jgi:hypothetical protein
VPWESCEGIVMTQLSEDCRKHLYRMILEFPGKQTVFMRLF